MTDVTREQVDFHYATVTTIDPFDGGSIDTFQYTATTERELYDLITQLTNPESAELPVNIFVRTHASAEKMIKAANSEGDGCKCPDCGHELVFIDAHNANVTKDELDNIDDR